MAESILDFALVAIILGALGLATLILLFMYSQRMRRPFQRCFGGAAAKTVDIESGIAPKRTTIRVVKSLPSQLPQPPTPTKFAANQPKKEPVRRVLTNPIPDIIEAESPSQKFMFIYPKKPNYQVSMEQATFQSGSTKSSYLPNRRNSR